MRHNDLKTSEDGCLCQQRDSMCFKSTKDSAKKPERCGDCIFKKVNTRQAKLVSCLHGSIFNVAVDIRPGDTFGYAYGEILSFENQKQTLVPRGFAHGYLTLEDDTLMQWCVDNNFCGEAARAVRYDSEFIWQTDPWPVREYILSEKDKNAIKLSELCKF